VLNGVLYTGFREQWEISRALWTASGMTRATKQHPINSLPAVSYLLLLQYDYGSLGRVQNHMYWLYFSEAQFQGTCHSDCLPWTLRKTKVHLVGQNELWSSANLYHQLQLLESLVPRTVCNNLSIFLLLTYSATARMKQVLMHGLMRSSSVHLQCYLQISAGFST